MVKKQKSKIREGRSASLTMPIEVADIVEELETDEEDVVNASNLLIEREETADIDSANDVGLTAGVDAETEVSPGMAPDMSADDVGRAVAAAENAVAAAPEALTDDALTGLLEALIFAADKPLTLVRLRQLARVADTSRLERLLAHMVEESAAVPRRGILLQCISGGYQFRSHPRYAEWVQELIAGRPTRLSRAQLETLAIIAYRQPVTRPEIDEVRGVDTGGTLKVLHDRGLIRVLGRKEDVGRPLLYGTTKEFLDFFSLSDLRELPTLREYAELSDESRDKVRAAGHEPEAAFGAEMSATELADAARAVERGDGVTEQTEMSDAQMAKANGSCDSLEWS